MLRLPAHVSASEIDLHFDLDPSRKHFSGTARYTLHLAKRTRKIELHTAELRVSRVRLRVGEKTLEPLTELRPESESIVFQFDRLLPAETVELELAFRGQVRNDLRGLYRSVDRAEPWLATQLCPTDARRFFPCFDEPGMKARYRIRVTAPRNQMVLSNSPVESESAAKDRKTIQFETTPPLSSYLVAVAVGPFAVSAQGTSRSTKIRVVTLPGKQELAAFALQAAAESLPRLEDWFGIDHPYPKLDLVALPDFAFGAMENAGAVFFRDSILLLDPNLASSEDRKRASETIAHEISHMWFGNLVTMQWWNDLWLNESFATWMAYEIIDDWQPEWHIWLDFAHRREQALEVDALASSHPIAPKIRSAEEAHENFDAITYTKGACVLRMLAGYLGRDVFQEGIRLYIRRHREGAATASDLWAALEEVSGMPVDRIVSPWTLLTGYPIVSLARGERQTDHFISLVQERFLALPRGPSRSKDAKTKWTIPWVGRVGGERPGDSKTIRHLLSKFRDQIPSQGGERSWFYGNANESGFFRIAHAEPERAALLENLQSLSAVERIGFVGHQWALARTGRVPISSLLDLLAMLGKEEDPDVLRAAESVLLRLLRRLATSRGADVVEKMRGWIAEHYAGQMDPLGFEPDPNEDGRTRARRARIISILGHLAQVESVGHACSTRCAEYLSKGKALSPELGDDIVRIAAGLGDDALHTLLCDSTRSAETPQARRRTLFALAEFDQPKLVRASLRASLDVGIAPAPDRAVLISAMLSSPATAPATWIQLQKSWPKLEKQMPPILLARLAGATADALPIAAASEIRDFFGSHPLQAGSRVLRQIAEEMAIAKRFEVNSGADLEAYLIGE